MPSRQRRDVAAAARAKVRDQMASEYTALAQVEAQRAELVEAAMVAVQKRRDAEAAIAEADGELGQAARALVEGGLSPGEVGDLLGVEARQLRQLLRAAPATKPTAVASGDGSGDGDQ